VFLSVFGIKGRGMPNQYQIYLIRDCRFKNRSEYTSVRYLECRVTGAAGFGVFADCVSSLPLLNRYLTDIGQTDCLSLAWNVMNDLYKSSIVLEFSPHSLALGVIFFVLVFKNIELQDSW